ncbi:hypothetical protein ITJ66_02425 [Plantibacter sp. VKM Ac-2885]|uniref:hypothetical protein n=1 Tax=Plantibacter sp. VKM Ac-2885 TaxID=2783828 RepID=UPI00188C3B2F|nr:hypothetical protein [Plantibacter sp. VKM Ac-2885]MBF4511329.1 hypothetical protein [Plantibacter sp. VKM Ac-2885]
MRHANPEWHDVRIGEEVTAIRIEENLRKPLRLSRDDLDDDELEADDRKRAEEERAGREAAA